MAGERFELKEMQKLEGHTDKVLSLAWNPVARTVRTPAILASCSADKTVRIWMQNPNSSTFHCRNIIDGPHTKAVSSCSWSPSGHLLAIASFDGNVYIWNKTETSFEFWYSLEDKDEDEVKKGDKDEVESVSWDALTGAHVATCSRDKSVCIWRVLTENDRELLQVSVDHTQDDKVVQWHPTKDILFSCSNNTIKVWPRYDVDIDQWNCGQTLDDEVNGHSSTVRSISFNATGDKMVTSGDDLSIKIWGAEGMQSRDNNVTWKLLQTLSGYHDQAIFSVHWSSEGIIASGAADDAICLFEENQDGLEREGAMYKLLLRKKNAHKTGVNSEQLARKEMLGMLTNKRPRGQDVDLVQQGPNPFLQQKHKDILELILPKEKTEVTAVQWGPKETKMLASSSSNGTIKIWELTPRP